MPLSFDHKPSQPEESARIVNAGGFVVEANGHSRVNGNLNLSRALGDLKYKQTSGLDWSEQMITGCPDVTEHLIHEDDEFVIIACDGVWDILSNQEAVDFVRSRADEPLEKICEQIFDHCISDDPKQTRVQE